MARPRKIERLTPEWPKIRRRDRKDGTASWMVDSGGPISPTVGRIQRTFRTEEAARSYAVTLRSTYSEHAQSGFGITSAQRTDAEAAFKLLENAHADDVRLCDAVRFYLTHHRPMSGDINLADLRTKFLENRRENGLRPDSIADLDRRTDSLVKALKPKRLARDVTPTMIRQYVNRADISPLTARNDFSVAAAMFAFALRPDAYRGRRTRKDAPVTGWIASNPCAGIPKPHVADDTPPSVLTIDECISLLRAGYASRHTHPDGSFFGDEFVALLPFVALGLFAGLRPIAEIRRLDWRQIDLDAVKPVVAITRSKTRAGIREVELCPAAVAWLRLCPEPQTGLVVTSKNFQKRFRRLCSLAGITAWQQDSMRHTFASCHYRTGQNAAHTAAQLGHAGAPSVLFTHYRNAVSLDTATRFWKLTPATVLDDSPANIVPIACAASPDKLATSSVCQRRTA